MLLFSLQSNDGIFSALYFGRNIWSRGVNVFILAQEQKQVEKTLNINQLFTVCSIFPCHEISIDIIALDRYRYLPNEKDLTDYNGDDTTILAYI
jgi:hypothetical protein